MSSSRLGIVQAQGMHSMNVINSVVHKYLACKMTHQTSEYTTEKQYRWISTTRKLLNESLRFEVVPSNTWTIFELTGNCIHYQKQCSNPSESLRLIMKYISRMKKISYLLYMSLQNMKLEKSFSYTKQLLMRVISFHYLSSLFQIGSFLWLSKPKEMAKCVFWSLVTFFFTS